MKSIATVIGLIYFAWVSPAFAQEAAPELEALLHTNSPVILGTVQIPQRCQKLPTHPVTAAKPLSLTLAAVRTTDEISPNPEAPSLNLLALSNQSLQGFVGDSARHTASGIFLMTYQLATDPDTAIRMVQRPQFALSCFSGSLWGATVGGLKNAYEQGDVRLGANATANMGLVLLTGAAVSSWMRNSSRSLPALDWAGDPHSLTLSPALTTVYALEPAALTPAWSATLAAQSGALFAVKSGPEAKFDWKFTHENGSGSSTPYRVDFTEKRCGGRALDADRGTVEESLPGDRIGMDRPLNRGDTVELYDEIESGGSNDNNPSRTVSTGVIKKIRREVVGEIVRWRVLIKKTGTRYVSDRVDRFTPASGAPEYFLRTYEIRSVAN